MARFFRHLNGWLFALALLLALGTLSACGRGRGRALEVMYVSAPQAFLRDRVAAVYNKTGTVTNGDRVEVTRYAGEADYSAVVLKTFERFKQGAAKDYLIRYRDAHRRDRAPV